MIPPSFLLVLLLLFATEVLASPKEELEDVCYPGSIAGTYHHQYETPSQTQYRRAYHNSVRDQLRVYFPGDAVNGPNGRLGILQRDCSVAPIGVEPNDASANQRDAHFRTFGGDGFDFNGGCDLILLRNPGFPNGGMDIHIRTRVKPWGTYIETAVLRIGEDTLEVMGGLGQLRYWVNGKDGRKLRGGGGTPATVGGFPVQFSRISDFHRVSVDLGDGDTIGFQTFKHLVRVSVFPKTASKFVGSLGLLGSYPKGNKLARDGSTVLQDDNYFGQEWQVLSSEPKLFHYAQTVQHPMKCIMSDESTRQRRQQRQQRQAQDESIASSLTSSRVSEAATMACANVHEGDHDGCIFDSMIGSERTWWMSIESTLIGLCVGVGWCSQPPAFPFQ